MDLNVRIIKAVECSPLLYKGQATIEERQIVWQQISHELCLPESVLKSRWHILCAYYQRSLEKRRSTDAEENDNEGATRSDFRYEKEMAFMMPYMHARIAIAAANAARKQQEFATAGNNELIDPEFIITEKDIENAVSISNSQNDEYMFYEVEKLEGEVETAQIQQQYQHHINESSITYENGEDEESHEHHLQLMHSINDEIAEVIEEVDESGNIVVQDLIIESASELITEDGEQIVVEDEEVMHMDDQIELQTETVVEEVIEENPSLEDMHETYVNSPSPTPSPSSSPTPLLQLSNYAVIIHGNRPNSILRLPVNTNGRKLAKIEQVTTSSTPSLSVIKHEIEEQQDQEEEIEQTTPSFAQEHTLMTRRRRAVVLKATPRVQVELTDNAVANSQLHEDTDAATIDFTASTLTENDDINTNNKPILERLGNHSRYNSSDHDNRSNDSNAVTTTAIENEEDHTPKVERSEDTIFGELVTAMLKHMPKERKRAIKKSIMDLLLT